MNRKELTKTIMIFMIGLHGLYKIFQRCKG